MLVIGLLVGGAAFADRPYRGGAAAAAHPAATEAALGALDAGGNAVDAMVAAAFVMGVVAPYHNGIAGGGFALVHLGGRTEVLDFREVAPARATRDMYLRGGVVDPRLSLDGGTSVAVPGAVAGYLALHQRYGKLERAALLAPAIRAARDGFWVTPKYQQLIHGSDRAACLRRFPESARLFLQKNVIGLMDVPTLGTVIRQPELAKTLQAISDRGAQAFYAGPLAEAMARAVQQDGGVLTVEDLRAYQVRWRAPLEGSYRGHRIATMPPPSAGGLTLLQVLGLLELRHPEGLSANDPDQLHTLTEAMKRAFLDRLRYLGDPAFVDIPLERLRSREHLEALSAQIGPRATPATDLLAALRDAGEAGLPSDKQTSHLSVVDRDGNAVSLTTTNNYAFGACLTVPGTGILMNDQMDDFAANPGAINAYGLLQGERNAIAPGKIPLSSMSPTLVFQRDRPQEVMLVVGGRGGSKIPTSVLQVVTNVVDLQLELSRAVGRPRIHHQLVPDVLHFERGALDPATVEALRARGHTVTQDPGLPPSTEAVMVHPETRLRFSSSDPRTEGTAVGQD